MEITPQIRDRDRNRICRPDLVMRKGGQTFVVELKLYRSPSVSHTLLEQAAAQLLRYGRAVADTGGAEAEHQKPALYLAALCQVDPAYKAYYKDTYRIHILDVGNLLYLSQKEPRLFAALTQLLPYSTDGIPSVQPEGPICTVLENHPEERPGKASENTPADLLARLQQCKPGKTEKASRQYEQICTEIIHYLFTPEFSKEVRQHKTSDKLFRMDLLCALKGATAFWKFLIRYYHTYFVVFEYKNYSTKLSQNLIYITEKYLYDAALRNVAFILSRKGFDRSAQNAALGCLKEHKKLILDLTDADLEQMIRMKQEGEEPSDYLLSKVEDYLMSIGK